MKLIGYWITSLDDEEYPAPQEVVGALEPDIREALANYLDSEMWPRIGHSWGYSWCRFFCGVSVKEMGDCEVTDGIWAWPEGLSHYVREHGILLPQDFIDRVLDQGSDVGQFGAQASHPVTAPLSENSVPEYSLSYWREWCSTRRSGEFLAQLRHAHIASDERANSEEDRMIAELIAEHGLGNDACIWAGCDEQVVSGMAICPRHTVTNTYTSALQFEKSKHFSITPEFMMRCFGSETARHN